jgi:stage II sporulation protein Q
MTMKLKNKTENFKSGKMKKKVDPISLALVVLLGVSATFATWQLAFNQGDAPAITIPTPDVEDDYMAVNSNDPELNRLLNEEIINPVSSENYEVTMNFFIPSEDIATVASSIFWYSVSDNAEFSQESVGMSFSGPNGDVTDVVSVLSGVVSDVHNDEVLSRVIITIDHENGAQSVFSGVYNSELAVGDEVVAGAVIGQTGLSRLEPNSGNVVHFEFIHNGTNLNPADVIGQRLGDL